MDKNNYKSGVSKIIANIDRLIEFKKHNILRPVTLDVSPTNQCNLNCTFCSVKNRDRDEVLFLGQALSTVRKYMELGIKSVVLTGGGEPTLWKYFDQFVIRCKDVFQLKLGMITNGLKLHEIDPKILARFEWIRVSLNGLDVNLIPDLSTIPTSVDLSLNYVWVNNNPHADKVMLGIQALVHTYPNISIVKIEKDIFRKESISATDDINILLLKHNCGDKVFLNQKDKIFVPKVCYMGWVKPHLDANGQVYRCVCSAFDARELNLKHLMPVDPGFTPDNDWFDTSVCTTCFFDKQNDFIYDFIGDKKHSDFI